ncbi:MAG: two-component regulator propeller domain-containing protein, partial [Alloprevotella sp.]|nr:two-component regulator propeller domain-containing protein [Alloprevotella sp.]
MSASSVFSQQFQASLSHYSTENGLCSNAVSDIKQDGYGYIWIATWNGLSRFDGFNFFNYKTGGQSRVPLLHNRISDLTIDGMQNVWMRMYDGRVFMLDRSTDRIINP